jgi:uncharacterized protein YndB with AHSA1/START domain
MADQPGRFGATVVIDRPIDEVFAFLADGVNDKKFSSRIVEMEKTTDGPPGAGSIYASTAKDGPIKAKHEFELIAFEPPRRIRWKELTTNTPVVVPQGGRPGARRRGYAADVLQRPRGPGLHGGR